jgi:phosphohistidine phosphatase SixA
MTRSILFGALFFVGGYFAANAALRDRPAAWAVAAPVSIPGDANGDGQLNLADPVYLLRFLFQGGESPAPCQSEVQPVSTVLVVRHAEKASSPASDPPLTPEGEARANTLAQMLSPTKLDALVSSKKLRTIQTLQPTETLKNTLDPTHPIAITQIEDDKDNTATIDQVVAFLDALPAGSTAVVCHHSFTIPGILRKLGLSDDEVKSIDVSAKFNNFAVIQRRRGAPPQLVHLTYGEP